MCSQCEIVWSLDKEGENDPERADPRAISVGLFVQVARSRPSSGERRRGGPFIRLSARPLAEPLHSARTTSLEKDKTGGAAGWLTSI